MISNQILQNTIEGLKAITRIDLCVMDIEGKVLASTFSNAEDYEKFVLEFVNSPADSQVLQGFQFFKVFDEHQLEFIILARGDSDDRQGGVFPDPESAGGLQGTFRQGQLYQESAA